MAGRVIPETSNRADWARLVAQGQKDAQKRTKTLEGRVTALEAPATLTLTPGSAPGSPTEGMIYYDDTANKLKCWDGTAWNDLW